MKELKCAKCAHFYRTMVGNFGAGYNPAPSCYCYEDTGKSPKVLTQECFEPRKGKCEKRAQIANIVGTLWQSTENAGVRQSDFLIGRTYSIQVEVERIKIH